LCSDDRLVCHEALDPSLFASALSAGFIAIAIKSAVSLGKFDLRFERGSSERPTGVDEIEMAPRNTEEPVSWGDAFHKPGEIPVASSANPLYINRNINSAAGNSKSKTSERMPKVRQQPRAAGNPEEAHDITQQKRATVG